MEDNKDVINEEVEDIKEETSEDISNQMEEISERVEEELEGQKELMFFKHMFTVYNSSKVQTIISFLITIGLYSLRMILNETATFLPIQMIIAVFAALGINSAISLIRCCLNKEIKDDIRKLSMKLGIYLFLAIVCIFVIIIFV